MEETDVKTDQGVDGQGVTQVATGAGVAEVGKASTVLADGTKQDEHTIPKTRFDEVNEAKKEAEDELALTKLKLDQSVQLQMQTSQQQQAGQVQQQPGSTYELAMQQLGYTADDLFGENLVKVNRLKSELDTALQQQQSVFTSNQQFVARHPDFTQVVGTVNPATGQIMVWSNEVLLLQQKMPYIANLSSAKDVYETVINARKLAELEKNVIADQEHQTRVNNETLPMGASAAGGSGGSGDIQQKMMSRQEVAETEARLESGEL